MSGNKIFHQKSKFFCLFWNWVISRCGEAAEARMGGDLCDHTALPSFNCNTHFWTLLNTFEHSNTFWHVLILLNTVPMRWCTAHNLVNHTLLKSTPQTNCTKHNWLWLPMQCWRPYQSFPPHPPHCSPGIATKYRQICHQNWPGLDFWSERENSVQENQVFYSRLLINCFPN